MQATAFHHDPFEFVTNLFHRIDQFLAHAGKTLDAAHQAALLCEDGKTLNTEDLRRLGLID